jgi:hypothetical protein
MLGAAGLLALVSSTSAKTGASTSAPNNRMSYQLLLGEEEIFDVSAQWDDCPLPSGYYLDAVMGPRTGPAERGTDPAPAPAMERV